MGGFGGQAGCHYMGGIGEIGLLSDREGGKRSNRRMDSGTDFRRINGAEEDGRYNSGVSLGLGFSQVLNCGIVIWRIWRNLRHRCSRMMAEQCYSIHGQVGIGWQRSALSQNMQVFGDVMLLGMSRTSSALALFLFSDGRGQRGLGSRFSSTASTRGKGREFIAACFSLHYCVGISWFSTTPVRTSILLCLFILLMCLNIYRIDLYGKVSRCAELWRTFISPGNGT